jgi:hypothetical protein
MGARLTTDIQVADLVVDVSNTAWSRTADGGSFEPRLGRVAEAIEAYAHWASDPDLLVYAVADWSLARRNSKLAEKERLQLLHWYNEGRLEIHDCADKRILEVASLTGIRVMSADLFRDFRIEHPWIEGNQDRFVKAVPSVGGALTIEMRDMEYFAADASIWMEKNELKGQGLLRPARGRPRRDVLGRLWCCPQEGCRWFGTIRGATQPVPRFVNGRVVCPLHPKHELIDVGPRVAAVQVKVKSHGEVKDRFLVAEGQPVEVGRNPTPGGYSVARWLDAEAAVRVSRSHLVLALGNGALRVQDISANGTRVQTVAHGREPAASRELARGQSCMLGLGDEIFLEGGVSLVRSGRRFPYEMPDDDDGLDPLLGDGLDAGDSSPTQWIR